jgi:DNA-binding transcriptional MerR regulator
MNIKDVAALFQYSESTIRNWSVEFVEYFSTDAQGAGRSRHFVDEDLTVFALIAQMKRTGYTFDDIHASLAAGQRADPPPKDGLLPVPVGILNELTRLRDQVALLQTTQEENMALKIRIAQLEAELKVQREMGRMEGELEALRKQISDSKPS